MDIAKLKEYFPPDAPDLAIEQQTFRDQVTGYLHQILESSDITKKDLSRKIGITPAAVTKLLSGDRNFSLDKLTEIAFRLGYVPSIEFRPMGNQDDAGKAAECRIPMGVQAARG